MGGLGEIVVIELVDERSTGSLIRFIVEQLL